jgi:hypothetical protein
MKRSLLISMLICICVTLIGGCAATASKGQGAFLTYKSEIKLLDGPASGQVGVNGLFQKGEGPADDVAAHAMPDPTTSKAARSNRTKSVSRRAARN